MTAPPLERDSYSHCATASCAMILGSGAAGGGGICCSSEKWLSCRVGTSSCPTIRVVSLSSLRVLAGASAVNGQRTSSSSSSATVTEEGEKPPSCWAVADTRMSLSFPASCSVETPPSFPLSGGLSSLMCPSLPHGWLSPSLRAVPSLPSRSPSPCLGPLIGLSACQDTLPASPPPLPSIHSA
eukprot:scaffold124911_cov36-Tisochrysis_lutea.AAC.1